MSINWLLNSDKTNWNAYQQGYEKCKEVRNDIGGGELNPYPKHSIEWMSWNKGWNACQIKD